MIRLEHVKKYFNRRKPNEIRAINNTSVELGDKGLVTFLGNSGCGKTTLLNAIGGLDKVDSGTIFIDNQRITKISSNKNDEIRNINIGYIFQNYNLIDDDTVFNNVALVLSMMGLKDKAEIEKRVMYILKRLGIERYRNRPAKMLSGGERQRVGIARALVKNPKIIIADEPTGNLDSKNTIEIMNIIKAISREKLVILVTHERKIAEFYSSRIIEIVDGRIVKDMDNSNDGQLDYRIDDKIYLKDMEVKQTLDTDNLSLSYYSDKPAEKVNVKIVVKNNNIYVETDGDLQAGLENIEMVDEHYQAMSKDMYEEYEFGYEKMIDASFVPKYSSVFTLGTLLKGGYKKVFRYSIIKKILLLGFIFASMFIIYSVSNTAGILDIQDKDFVNVNKNYLTVKTAKIKVDEYNKYESMEGIDYIIPGDSYANFMLKIDDYYQTAGGVCIMSGSLADVDMIKEENIIAGEKPANSREIAVDKMTIERMLETTKEPQQIGLKKVQDFIGRKVNINNLDDFTIVGIVDLGSPSIYTEKGMFMNILTNQESEEALLDEDSDGEETSVAGLVNYKLIKSTGDIKITQGEAPKNSYECIVDNSLVWEKGIGSTIDTKVNGKKLKIVGFYSDKRGRNQIYVSPRTAKTNYIVKQKNITISPKNKEETYQQLMNSGVKVIDNYAIDKEMLINSNKKVMFATVLVSLVILIISLLEMYLMLRSSFLSRIKEVGVLRAIGLKKRDIYKMFMGEIFALTTLTAIPAMLVMAYILDGVSKIPHIGSQYMMNPMIIAVSFLLVLIFNLLAGLLPVFLTIRKTPAAILARNDVN